MSGSVDYRTFAGIRDGLSGRPGMLDVSRTDMAAALLPLLPPVLDRQLPDYAYRCHLAEDWLALFGLAPELRREAMVGIGVRQALSILFGLMAERGSRVAIPSDVYPVYVRLAADAGVGTATYDSFPRIDLEAAARCDALLVCNPMKPRGSALSAAEVDDILSWLGEDTRRRVVVDAVYTFGTRLDPGTLRLMGTGRAWVLHSLSKGWARPLVMGVALAPPGDLDDGVLAAFRSAPHDRERLREAHALLRAHPATPASIAPLLAEAEARLRSDLGQRGVAVVPVADPACRYLFLVEGDWREILERANVLALPSSVFGREVDGMSVASSLGHLPVPASG